MLVSLPTMLFPYSHKSTDYLPIVPEILPIMLEFLKFLHVD